MSPAGAEGAAGDAGEAGAEGAAGEAGAEVRAPGGQREAPYLDALLAYSGRGPARLHVPGHKGGSGADPGLVAALGLEALRLDIPALTWGIDVGEAPTPFDRAQELAAAAWGARRTWSSSATPTRARSTG
jgi:lysine decarboxylase